MNHAMQYPNLVETNQSDPSLSASNAESVLVQEEAKSETKDPLMDSSNDLNRDTAAVDNREVYSQERTSDLEKQEIENLSGVDNQEVYSQEAKIDLESQNPTAVAVEQNIQISPTTSISLEDIRDQTNQYVDGLNQLMAEGDNLSSLLVQKTKELANNISQGSDGWILRGSQDHRKQAGNNASELNDLIQEVKTLFDEYSQKMREAQQFIETSILEMESEKNNQAEELNALYSATSVFDYQFNPWQSQAGQEYNQRKPRIQERIRQLEQEISKTKSQLKTAQPIHKKALERYTRSIAEAEKKLSDSQKTLENWK
jgi:hypothetical protein